MVIIMQTTVKCPPESLDKEAGIMTKQKKPKKKCRAGREWLRVTYITQTNFFKSPTVCQSGPQPTQLLTETVRCVYCLYMPFLSAFTDKTEGDDDDMSKLLSLAMRVITLSLISSHLLKWHPASVDTIQLVHASYKAVQFPGMVKKQKHCSL